MNVDVQKFFADSANNYAELATEFETLPALPEEEWLKVLKAWEQGKLLGLGFNPDGSIRSWANVCAHQIAVASAGYQVARALAKPLSGEDVTPEMVCLALLVHDADKQHRHLWLSKGPHITYDVVRRSGQHEIERLEKLGFSRPIARAAAVTNEWGMQRIFHGRATLSEMIAWFTDACVLNNNWVSFKERIGAMQGSFKQGGQYSPWNEYLKATYGDRTHYEIWRAAAEIVAAEFRKHLGDHDFLDTPFHELKL